MISELDGVKVLDAREASIAKAPTTCGQCGRTWDDAVVTDKTPTPGGRCPFEYFHAEDEATAEQRFARAQRQHELTGVAVANLAKPFVVEVVKNHVPNAVAVHTVAEESPFVEWIEVEGGGRVDNAELLDELHDTPFFWGALSFVDLGEDRRGYGKLVIQ